LITGDEIAVLNRVFATDIAFSADLDERGQVVPVVGASKAAREAWIINGPAMSNFDPAMILIDDAGIISIVRKVTAQYSEAQESNF